MTKPPRSILDPAFRYVPAHETDIRKTFARVRREQVQEEESAKSKTGIVATGASAKVLWPALRSQLEKWHG